MACTVHSCTRPALGLRESCVYRVVKAQLIKINKILQAAQKCHPKCLVLRPGDQSATRFSMMKLSSAGCSLQHSGPNSESWLQLDAEEHPPQRTAHVSLSLLFRFPYR